MGVHLSIFMYVWSDCSAHKPPDVMAATCALSGTGIESFTAGMRTLEVSYIHAERCGGGVCDAFQQEA
jgi:hypothetical protein